jgi:hypothetical protein
MNRQNVSACALSKLLELSAAAEFLSEKVIATEQGIANARLRLTGGMKQADYDDLRSSLSQMIADLPMLKQRTRAAESIYSKCKQWLDDFPADVVLETVEVKTDGHDIASVRGQIEVKQKELAQLRGLPTASADIEQRVRAYVDSMARPQISGLGKNERLKVIWPGGFFNNAGPREDKADVLALMMFLHPEEFVARLLRQIEHETSNVIPIKQRSARIAEIEAEIEQLSYVEEALLDIAIADGKDVQRSPNALPQAVLQVRVAEAAKASRTA